MIPLLLVSTPHGWGLAKHSPYEKLEVSLFVPVFIGTTKTAKMLMYKEKLEILGCVVPEEYYDRIITAIVKEKI